MEYACYLDHCGTLEAYSTQFTPMAWESRYSTVAVIYISADSFISPRGARANRRRVARSSEKTRGSRRAAPSGGSQNGVLYAQSAPI
jgi:hypothetical protein